MKEEIRRTLRKFMSDKLNTHITVDNFINKKESSILEFNGPAGSGKSYIFVEIKRYMKEKGIPFESILPHYFDSSQICELTCMFTKLTIPDFNEIIKQAEKYDLTSRYDFFYFLTRYLIKNELLEQKTVIIDDVSILDQYTLDFMQYLVEAAPTVGIKFITFSHEPIFTFSQKIAIPELSKKDISNILEELVSDTSANITKACELLQSMSNNDVFVIETLLTEMIVNNIISFKKITSHIDEKNNTKTLYENRINNLDETKRNLLVSTFLLEEYATIDNLKKLYPSVDINKEIKYLNNEDFIVTRDNVVFIRKQNAFINYFMDFNLETKKSYINQLLKYKNEFNINYIKIVNYLMKINEYDKTEFQKVIDYLTSINSNEKLEEIYRYSIDFETAPKDLFLLHKNLGLINLKLNRLEVAPENFRQALKLSTIHNFDSDEIVYELANSLFRINSSTFALEIIKKYSTTSDVYWICRLLLLKATVLMDLEKFDEALDVAQEAYLNADRISNDDKKNAILAEYRDVKGKIYYYNNQWEKAEIEFKEAERLYRQNNNPKGLAAVYNNLGVIEMYRGDWKKTEKFYLQSIDLEMERYNLNGLSVCYSNLGSLLDDEGNIEKSLHYLNQALKIQKLLNDRYNITYIYNNIGIIYMNIGEFDKSEEILKLSLETAMNFNLFRNIIASYNNLGALYFKSGDWTKAIEYYELAVEKSKENKFWDGLCQSYNNLGELYESREEYTLAHDLYFKAVELIPKITDEYLRAELYGNMGSVLTKMHNFGEAYRYLVESLDFFKSLDVRDKVLEGYLNHSIYFMYTNNYESSLYYLKNAKKLADELNNKAIFGKVAFIHALLEKNNPEEAAKLLEEAIENFKESNNKFELAQANYQYALVLLQKNDWEPALQILKETKRIIKSFNAIKFIEKIDLKIQAIHKEYAKELKESRLQDSLLNKFYEITQQLNEITDFESLLQTAIDNLVYLTEADGGILCLYQNVGKNGTWEYTVTNKIGNDKDTQGILMQAIQDSYENNQNLNLKQPYFAPMFNNIITLNLSIRNKPQGVVLLYSKHGSHYFTERMHNLISAICNQLIVIIENIKHSNLEKSHAIIREKLNSPSIYTNIIGKSEKMQEVFNLVDKIKDTPTTVLLEGPSGTGKELVARAIHYNSNRRNKPFVAQYCGALPETLLESELFGHVKGSFTGASYDKKGLFEIADGGTFFLDEIGDISLSTQAKLLRFLQEGEIKRVGSTTTQHVDVRVICATNVSLSEKVKAGEFRLDLYYRLNVIKIEMPSLKERKSDVPLLAIHFLDKYNQRINKNIKGITDEAMKYLMQCDWPGNIRQLENEIERAVTLVDNESFIKPSDLSPEVFKYSEQTETIQMLEKVPLKDAVESLEKKMILDALEKRGWNQTQAAKDLGLSRQGLIKKMKRYQFEK